MIINSRTWYNEIEVNDYMNRFKKFPNLMNIEIKIHIINYNWVMVDDIDIHRLEAMLRLNNDETYNEKVCPIFRVDKVTNYIGHIPYSLYSMYDVPNQFKTFQIYKPV